MGHHHAPSDEQRTFSGMEINTRWGQPKKIFFPFYTSNQNSVCTLGCLKPVEGIKKVLTFSKIGCPCNDMFSRPPRYFFTYLGWVELHKKHTIRKLSKRAFFLRL